MLVLPLNYQQCENVVVASWVHRTNNKVKQHASKKRWLDNLRYASVAAVNGVETVEKLQKIGVF
jgi:hypothetical protein